MGIQNKGRITQNFQFEK